MFFAGALGSIVLDNVGTDGSLEDIGERVASLAGLAVGGDDGNRGSAGHFGGIGLFVAVVDSKREDSRERRVCKCRGCDFSLSSAAKILALNGHSFARHSTLNCPEHELALCYAARGERDNTV
jgi:hypothetical protein